MKAVTIVLNALKKVTENKNAMYDVILFVLDNKNIHQSIIDNEGNFTDIIHDVRGLMMDDEHFVPRVLTKNKQI